MNRIRTYLLFPLFFVLFSCGPDPEKQQFVSSLDSLNGALSVLRGLLLNYDSLLLEKNLGTCEAYRVFLKNRANDTLSVEDAQNIKRFFQSAQQMESYRANKGILTQRCWLLYEQTGNLKKDVWNNVHDRAQLRQFLQREMEAGKELHRLIMNERNSLESAVKNYVETKPQVESYLRSKNEGQLPLNLNENPSL